MFLKFNSSHKTSWLIFLLVFSLNYTFSSEKVSSTKIYLYKNSGLLSRYLGAEKVFSENDIRTDLFNNDGYFISGWNTKSDGSGLSYTGSLDHILKDDIVKLYAQWKKIECNVKFHGNGHTDGDLPQITTVYYNHSYDISNINIGKNGYTFLGWSQQNSLDGDIIKKKVKVTQNELNLYALWYPNSYNIYYHDTRQYLESPKDLKAIYNSSIQINEIKMKTNSKDFVFVGWNTRSDGKGDHYYVGDMLIVPSNDVHLFDMWKLKDYSISFRDNGITVGKLPTRLRIQYDHAIKLPDQSGFKREKYDFVGWNTKLDGTGDSLSGTIKMPNHDLILFPEWELKTVNIVIKWGEKVVQNYTFPEFQKLKVSELKMSNKLLFNFHGYKHLPDDKNIIPNHEMIELENYDLELYSVWEFDWVELYIYIAIMIALVTCIYLYKKIKPRIIEKKRFKKLISSPDETLSTILKLEDILPKDSLNYFLRFRGFNEKKSISVCGMMNSGKSTFLNALLRDVSNTVFKPGDYRMTIEEQVEEIEDFILIDAPGFDATDSDNHIAFDSFIKGDYHFFIHDIQDGELSAPEISFLKQVENYSKIESRLNKTYCILTHADQLDSEEAASVTEKIKDQLVNNFKYKESPLLISSTDYIEGLTENEDELIQNSGFHTVLELLSTISENKLQDFELYRRHRKECISYSLIDKEENDKLLKNINTDFDSKFNEIDVFIRRCNHDISISLKSSIKIDNYSERIESLEKSIKSSEESIVGFRESIRSENEYHKDLNFIERGLRKSDHKKLKEIDRQNIREEEANIRGYEEKKDELYKLSNEQRIEQFTNVQKSIDEKLKATIEKIIRDDIYRDFETIEYDLTLNSVLSIIKSRSDANISYILISFKNSLKEILTIKIKTKPCKIIQKESSSSFIFHQDTYSSKKFDGINPIKFIKDNSLKLLDFIQMVDEFKIQLIKPPIEHNNEYKEIQNKIDNIDELIRVL